MLHFSAESGQDQVLVVDIREWSGAKQYGDLLIYERKTGCCDTRE